MKPALFVILTAALALSACATVTAAPAPTESVPVPTVIPTQGHLPNVDFRVYEDAKIGFSVQYPPTWQESDQGGYPVLLTLQAAPGTTLISKSFEIMVTENATTCKEMRYDSGSGTTSPENVTLNGIDFLKETGSGIGAGNIYDWTSYSTMKGSSCITLTLMLHSANSGVYSTEPAPFDRAEELKGFDPILNSFQFK
jgi:hypothetical protein